MLEMPNIHIGTAPGVLWSFFVSGVIKVYTILFMRRGVHLPKVCQCRKSFKSTRCTQVCRRTDFKMTKLDRCSERVVHLVEVYARDGQSKQGVQEDSLPQAEEEYHQKDLGAL